MVKITNYKLRQSLDGKSFFVLIVQGGVEIARSASGNVYATVKSASVPTTFDESTCKSLIGSELPGRIEKVSCEPYEYTVQETGEVILLTHRYEYMEQELPAVQDFTKVYQPSANGVTQMG